MSAKEILSSKEFAGNENRQTVIDEEEEDLKWKERRGRTLSVAFDSFDSELGRGGASLLEAELGLVAQFEPPGFAQPCQVTSHRETLSGLIQAFEVPRDNHQILTGAENELPGYTETQVKPFTVTDTVDVYNCAKEKSSRSVKNDQNPKTLSKSAVKWVYLQIWLYLYGFRYHFILCSLMIFYLQSIIIHNWIKHIFFRLALVILFAVALTSTIVGFWLGFERTAVSLSSF